MSFELDWSWNHFHLVGRRNMSFGQASKYVIWSGVEKCHLVGRQNMSFGQNRKGGGIITLQSKTYCFDWGFISKL